MRSLRVIGLAAILFVIAAIAPIATPELDEATQPWIVLTDGHRSDIAATIERLGGVVSRDLPIISGLAIRLPARAVPVLSSVEGVIAVEPDHSLDLQARAWESGDPNDQGALTNINKIIGASQMWGRGFDGGGVDIALIDSGVAPVEGLSNGNVVNGPDISFDSPFTNLQHLDFYGHGTHLGSIIVGNDGATPTVQAAKSNYLGVAPGARLVNVKVANAIGLADVSQVIAAIDWVVQNRSRAGLDIRVLVLAFGTDSNQDYRVDPLSMAVEQAWHNGIVVVTSAGNDGNRKPLRNPAHDPYVISVGAAETRGTKGTNDDRVLPFSNCGTETRRVDLVAPGRSVLGLRVPGSYIDANNPSAVVQGRLFRGTGTSQATAVVAGAAALLIDQRPQLTPDQVKALLVKGATPRRNATVCDGAGLLDVAASARLQTPHATQTWGTSDGTGLLEAARGSHHVSLDGVELRGEVDWLGGTWSGGTWSGGTWSGGTWSGGTWSGGTWSGGTWSGGTWSGGTWSGGTWSGGSWSGHDWS